MEREGWFFTVLSLTGTQNLNERDGEEGRGWAFWLFVCSADSARAAALCQNSLLRKRFVSGGSNNFSVKLTCRWAVCRTSFVTDTFGTIINVPHQRTASTHQANYIVSYITWGANHLRIKGNMTGYIKLMNSSLVLLNVIVNDSHFKGWNCEWNSRY